MKVSPTAINAYILAGGKSTRMGQDKGMTTLSGKPLVLHVYESLKTIFGDITIIANLKAYESLKIRVLPDLIQAKGPLGGIYSGLKDSHRPLNFFISCDMPFITGEAIVHLLQHAPPYQLSVAKVGERVQPLFGLYPTSLLPQVEKAITSHALKMTDFLASNGVHYIEFTEENWARQFANLNTIDALRNLGPN
ncbi:molybdenum cofactor guanylyltransferase [Pararhodonellum marinum]|uniref:molybdenum cofactor guanylyltransferase n=1 Tax=Pararhodonellum marinum TaxID=2755358 RepID=UPI00188FCE9E|nr:molybdenum cofactor guanylyltransferase [Pararhodonellum marinum]